VHREGGLRLLCEGEGAKRLGRRELPAMMFGVCDLSSGVLGNEEVWKALNCL